MEVVTFAAMLIIFLILAIIYFRHAKKMKRNTTIPGPDITDEKEGNLPDITASGSFHKYLRDIHAKYGPIVSFWSGQQMCVSIASPHLLKQIANIFDRPKILSEMAEPLITCHSIQFANGDEGRKRHTAYKRCFSQKNMRNQFSILHKLSKELSEKWANLPADEHIPISQFMFAFAIKSILAVAFGMFFRDDEKLVLEFKDAYDFTWSYLESRLWNDMADKAESEKFDKYKTQMMDLLWKAAEVAKKKPSDDSQFVEVVQNLGISEDTVKADMLTMAVGGFHNTALLLVWGIYFLATYPECQEKVYEELKKIKGNWPLLFDDISKLIYLRQVLDETLRCTNLAFFTARYNAVDDIEIGGHKIPAETPVIHALAALQNDEYLWPDPDRFDPDRFSKENSMRIPSFGFEPFGFAGKRKCPGYQLAYTETTILLAELVRRFKISLVEGQVVQPVYGFVNKPKEEIWITVDKRK